MDFRALPASRKSPEKGDCLLTNARFSPLLSGHNRLSESAFRDETAAAFRSTHKKQKARQSRAQFSEQN